MFGIDAGGTYIKIGSPETAYSMFPLPYTKAWVKSKMGGHNPPFLVTGAGSQIIADWYPEFTIIPELQATGLGGAALAGEKRCIVINIGSGTPVLFTDREAKEVTHITGTGMGSASLAGLSFYMTGIEDLDHIEKHASDGSPEKVNLLISDIYKNPKLIDLPPDATASNFGKYQDWRHLPYEAQPNKADLLAALHRMVAETIVVIATTACKQFPDENLPVVVTGGGTLNSALVKDLEKTFRFFDRPYVVPEHAEYSTLFGLFVVMDLI